MVVFTVILQQQLCSTQPPYPYNVAACLARGFSLMTDGSLFSHAGGNAISSISDGRIRHPASFKVNPAKTHLR